MSQNDVAARRERYASTRALSGPPTAVLSSSLLQPFILSPSNYGGRRGRKGFQFQDWWIAYTLAGLLANPTEFAFGRIEGVEDLDLLLRRDDRIIEQYIQLKSKQQGTGNWTVRSVEREGVFSRFFHLYRQFQATNQENDRAIELILVVEGDLDQELLQLNGPLADGAVNIFATLTAHLFSSKQGYEQQLQRVLLFCKESGREFLQTEDAEGSGLL